nr:uncharacterized protein LOC120098890 [Rattus norvegicus]
MHPLSTMNNQQTVWNHGLSLSSRTVSVIENCHEENGDGAGLRLQSCCLNPRISKVKHPECSSPKSLPCGRTGTTGTYNVGHSHRSVPQLTTHSSRPTSELQINQGHACTELSAVPCLPAQSQATVPATALLPSAPWYKPKGRYLLALSLCPACAAATEAKEKMERDPTGRKPVSKSADSQTYRRIKPLSETTRQTNTRDKLMVRGKNRFLNKRNQDYLASSEPSAPTKLDTGYPNTPEKQDLNLKIMPHDDD